MKKKIAVCIITYKRPDLLDKCMRSVLYQKLDFDLYVIDNDKNYSSKDIVKKNKNLTKTKIVYEVEKNKGIPFARNKAINLVKNTYDYLAFIDDDEEAERDWLGNLFNALIKYDADIVAGPVHPIVKPEYPKWIKYYLPKNKYSTGELIKTCATGNVIMKSSIFSETDKPFLEKFKNTGGSDSHLFSLLNDKGYKIVWTNDAVVKENIEENRLTLKWFLSRSFRVGNSKVFSYKSDEKYNKFLTGFIESFYKLILSIFIVIPFVLLYFLGFKKQYLKIIKRLIKSIGFITGIFGYKYEDYI